MALALFDLDNTLLAGDSDYLWGRFLVEQGLVDGDFYDRENRRFLKLYEEGKLDIFEFAAFAYKPLTEHDQETLDRYHQLFMQQKILPIITDKSRALVEEHRAKGDTLVIITATNAFVTAPIADEFGVEHLIATIPEKKAGRYTGKIEGTPCFQDGKVTRLKEWMQTHNIEGCDCSFYSDSNNDLPLLKLVQRPIAVDPDPRLATYAREHGWPIISLR